MLPPPTSSAAQAAVVASTSSSGSCQDLVSTFAIASPSSSLSPDTTRIEETIRTIRAFILPESLQHFDEQSVRDTATFVRQYWSSLSQLPGPYLYTSEAEPHPLPLRIIPGQGAFFDTSMKIIESKFKIVSLAVLFIEGVFLSVVHSEQRFTPDDTNKSYTTGKNELAIVSQIPPTADRIIQHFYGFEAPGCFHFYQEFAPGGALVDRIDAGKLTVVETHQFALDILRGLGQLDQLGIIHCDIKPDNILITYEFDPDTQTYKTIAKICDFGTSFFAKEKTWTNGTTVAYCSPEMLDGLSPIENDKIDPFAYGCTLLTMLKQDETPWHEMSMKPPPVDCALRRTLITSYVQCLLQRKTVLDTFLANLLAPDPQKRFTVLQAQEFASRLTVQDFASWSDPTAPVSTLTSQVSDMSIHESRP